MAAFTREDIKVRQLISGQDLEVPVFRFQGEGKGPDVYIQANIHGAEIQGNAAIYELLKYFQKNI